MIKTRFLTLLLAALCCDVYVPRAVADAFGSGANTFDIEFVTIGNPGNAGDSQVMICCGDSTGTSGWGSVPYSYRMGKFEISEQMIDKANVLGVLGITKDTRGPNKPATRVSWNEAARFVNWLNTSTGSTPAYKFAIQPGEPDYVANTNIELWTISDAGYNPNNLYRNSLANYFLPNVDEWYKAAYYDPTSGVYYDYPTGSDTAPTPVANGTATGTAVWDLQFGPADITLAGGLSPYGTMGQAGNAWEIDETDRDLVNGPSSDFRGARAGSWRDVTSNYMRASQRDHSGFPTGDSLTFGFRVSSISEPTFAGDFDHDGAVDAADLLQWAGDFGENALSDADNDGDSDGADFLAWQRQFGSGPPQTAASALVPEPTTALLLILVAAGLCARQNRTAKSQQLINTWRRS